MYIIDIFFEIFKCSIWIDFVEIFAIGRSTNLTQNVN